MNNVLKWSGCACILSGAILTSLRMPYNVYLFNLGSLLYAIWGFRVKEMNIWLLNTVLLVIYSYGMFN
jgi:hypothetical protein